MNGEGAEFIRIEHGKVAAEHLYYDEMELMMQLGLMSEQVPTA